MVVSGNNFSVNNTSISSDPWAYEPILYATLLSPIIDFGIVGNVLSILIWNKGKRRMTTTSRYMRAMAAADILVLAIPATNVWLQNVLNISLNVYSDALCVISRFGYYVPRVISAWILVVATVERAMGVWMPHRVRLSCRPNIAVFIIALVCVLLSVAYIPFYTELDYDNCGPKLSSFYVTHFGIITVFDLCMFFVIPFSIIVVCNISILIKIIKRKKAIQTRGSQTAGNRGSNHLLKTMTWRIIILSLTFCFCLAPLAIYKTVFFFDKHELDEWVGLYFVFQIMMFLNNGVNCIIYCLIGSAFRNDLIQMLKCRCRA